MKISNYALINIQELDDELTRIEKEYKEEGGDKLYYFGKLEQISLLKRLKDVLIHAENLASVAFDAGMSRYHSDIYGSGSKIIPSKQEFLNSEINL